ncbi:heavy-metal-associated domain-containing protein [Variovorax sp. Root473]|uniref:heavy-metal-associated domain-containing protein n=1 Tax=Variovorax sp. Root473 TaxID=1736541 RepID=UPI0006F6180B|nr:heavy-metal-associated domain-containing protein [Variovorax sp. Root473]KQX87436.1 copper-binding protein [Variovorax sp. Root473]
MQAFEIQSMTCGSCAGRITRAIKDLDPQARLEVDVKQRTVRIDTNEDRPSLVAALTEAGYPPSPSAN